jgi:predicted DNA binding CopG/RHH family protein
MYENTNNFSSDAGFSYVRLVKNLEAGKTYYYETKWSSSPALSSVDMEFTFEKYAPVEISEGTRTVHIAAHEITKFSFTPSESGLYMIRSNVDQDSFAALYNTNHGCLQHLNGNPNFQLLASLTAGETYYYEMHWYYSSASGDMEFTLEKYGREKISEGTYNVYIDAGERAVYRFTPSESGLYVFSNAISQKSGAELYDSGYKYLQGDSGNRNFRLVSNLEAGATYYYEAFWDDSTASGNMEVTLEKYSPVEITEGTYTVNIGVGERAEFSFTPVESGLYVFRSNAGQNSRAKLYNSRYSYLQHAYGDPNNFRLAASLEAGATYYYEVFWDDPSASGDMQVTLERDGQPIPHAPLEIVTQPESVKAYKGEKAVVTVEASGEGLTYQWYLKNKTASKFSKSSVTKNTYSVTMSDAVDGRQIYCVITADYGDSVTTDTVTLSQREELSIAVQPMGVTVGNGEKATVTVEARGEDLTYQWYLKNKTSSKFTKSSVTKNVYSVTMTDTVDGRQVYCVVTDKYGNSVTTRTATLSKYMLAIVTEPEDVEVENGEKATVSVEASGEGLTYQWYVKNKTASKFSKSSIKTNTYSVKMSDTVDGRQVYCIITDKYGNSVTTRTATLSKPVALAIVTEPSDVIAEIGEKATVTFEATGVGLTYQWYIKNKTASKFAKSSVTKSAYSVTMSDAVDGRQVYCVVTDQDGNSLTTKTVTLYSNAVLRIVEQPSDANAAIGKKVETKVVATGQGLTYQWYIKNATATKFSASSVKSATYSTTMTDKVDGRQAYCIITDANGDSVQTVTVIFRKN